MPVALKGAFFSCGQNCAGAERFFVQEGIYDAFVQQVVGTTARMRQGPTVGGGTVDCGAMCMPGLAEKVGELVDNAVQHGAKVSKLCITVVALTPQRHHTDHNEAHASMISMTALHVS